MKLERDRRPFGCVLGLLLVFLLTPHARGQTAADEPVQSLSPIGLLGLTGEKASRLSQAVDARDYPAAERLLLNEIEPDPTRFVRLNCWLSRAESIFSTRIISTPP